MLCTWDEGWEHRSPLSLRERRQLKQPLQLEVAEVSLCASREAEPMAERDHVWLTLLQTSCALRFTLKTLRPATQAYVSPILMATESEFPELERAF